MLYDLVIRNGMVVKESGIAACDIAVKDQKIVKIADCIPQEEQGNKEIDAGGLYILPGLIDEHVHFDEPGPLEREGFVTGSASLAASGVTTFFDHPVASNPPVINSQAFLVKKEIAEEKSLLDFGILGGLTPENSKDLLALKELGAIGFKGFMSNNSGMAEFPFLDDAGLIRGMEKIAEIGGILLLHAENEAMCSYLAAKNRAMGKTTFFDYEASRPVTSEVEAVERAAAFAGITKCKVHILHVSSREVVKAVNRAKEKGIDITVETCPHYLSLDVGDFPKLAGAKCAPPLRKKEHIESLWEAIKAGEIDTIGSDHSSMPLENGAWGGLSGGQSSLPVLLEEGYFKRNIPLETIVALTSYKPAKRFGLYPQKGAIAIGFDADMALVDLRQKFTLGKKDLLDRHSHSPYVGKTFRGAVKYTIARGEIIWEYGNITGKIGRGKMVVPAGIKEGQIRSDS